MPAGIFIPSATLSEQNGDALRPQHFLRRWLDRLIIHPSQGLRLHPHPHSIPYPLRSFSKKPYGQRRTRICRRPNPVLKVHHSTLSHRVFVAIIELLQIELRIFDLLRCIGIHPEPIFSLIIYIQTTSKRWVPWFRGCF